MHAILADIDPTAWLGALKALNSETDTTMLDAELLWFCGGLGFAFTMCAFSMILRATRGAVSNVDL